MNTKRIIKSLILWLMLFSLASGACTQAPTPTEAAPAKLRMVLLPILDTLPMYVAQKEGLFAKHGLNVELVPVGSAAERDQVISAGQADGMINDLLSTALYNKDQTRVQVVRFAQVATPKQAMFRLLSAGNSGLATPQDLKGVEIGISQGTIIEYLTNRLLQTAGLAPNEIKTLAVPKIPDRMALLASGKLKAAMLPEPLSSLAVQQGAKLILDDTQHPEYSNSTYAFRKETIDQNPEAIRSFLTAIEEAIGLINADPAKWSSLLTDQKLVPVPLAGSFQVPTFVTASVPSQAQWQDVLAWAKEKGILKTDVAYTESVNASFLPK